MTHIDWSHCTIVKQNPAKLGGVPTVRDYRVSADAIIENHDDQLADEEIAFQFSLPVEDVRAIVAYVEKARADARYTPSPSWERASFS